MNRLEAVIRETAVRTFEDMAFLFPESEEAEAQPPEPEAGVSVAFHGPIQGRLVLTVCAELLPAIAMNMLGEDEPPPRSQQLDAVGEITNVVCGNILPAITDATQTFHLDGPVVLSRNELAAVAREDSAAFVSLNTDYGYAGFRFLLDCGIAR